LRNDGRDHRGRADSRSRCAPVAAGGFDLMLVDIFMPHMRGFESIRIFHERAPTIRWSRCSVADWRLAQIIGPPTSVRAGIAAGSGKNLFTIK